MYHTAGMQNVSTICHVARLTYCNIAHLALSPWHQEITRRGAFLSRSRINPNEKVTYRDITQLSNEKKKFPTENIARNRELPRLVTPIR